MTVKPLQNVTKPLHEGRLTRDAVLLTVHICCSITSDVLCSDYAEHARQMGLEGIKGIAQTKPTA